MVATPSTSRRQQGSATALERARAATAARMAEAWYARHGRDFPWRHWTDRYRLLVTEILLQRTSAGTVAAFIPDFFDRFPGWTSLATVELAQLEELLLPIGLHRRRAASLRALALAMLEEQDRPLATLPGVGQYVERAVLVASESRAEAMVDSNFVRILTRVFGGPWMADYRFDRRLQELARSMAEAAQDPRALNWSILDLGALVCRPRAPLCRNCPLQSVCEWGSRETADLGLREEPG